MSAKTVINCPRCTKAISVSTTLQSGAKLRCPLCNSMFAMQKKAPNADASKGRPQSSAVASRRPVSSKTGHSIADASVSTQEEQGKQKAFLVVVCAMLLIGLGVVALVYLKPAAEPAKMTASKKEPDRPDAGKEPPGSGKLQPTEKKDTSGTDKKPAPKTPEKQPVPQKPLPKPFPQGPPKEKPDPKKNPPNPIPVDPIEPVEPIDPIGGEPKPKLPDVTSPKKPISGSQLTTAEQKKVDAAIASGVAYLRKSQTQKGAWPESDEMYSVGYVAIPALTLLECDVPPYDPVIQRAAAFVRRYSVQAKKTYNISTAILFLDRLGDPRDRPLIQSLALRLLGGQHRRGEWGYDCPILSHQQMVNSTTALLKYRRNGNSFADPLAELDGKPAKEPSELAKNWDHLKRFNYPFLPNSVVLTAQASKLIAKAYFKPNGDVAKLPEWGTAAIPNVRGTLAAMQKASSADRQNMILNIKNRKGYALAGNGVIGDPSDFQGDHSNTQFAMLGLWAARRHGVPTEHAIRLAAIRFMVFQGNGGGWTYSNIDNTTRNGSMTGVGLLGLALGYGVADAADNQAKKNDVLQKALNRDPSIQNGLRTFGSFLTADSVDSINDHKSDTYFIWTVERVAVLYNLPTIAGQDWYRWGMRTLLPAQTANGSWEMKGFVGSTTPIDTSFALLFLKRSNLLRDLSENLRFYRAISR